MNDTMEENGGFGKTEAAGYALLLGEPYKRISLRMRRWNQEVQNWGGL